ncbi:Uncharacterized protein PHPALM_14100 [Phytophthora palmivora]|uniref:DDE Tnp4 domain-containing protein n=1 Tax=Phytophthora palmivora TaxID=4796 RepID=A0A2P4XVL9_9STRA|nr:Uncharacterized protein PHPALM_14100 [Phytophthora palmivora]
MGAEVTKNELKFLMSAIMLSLGIEFPYALAHLMRFQKQAFSGHKKLHCIKFQSVTMANGLIVSFFGPYEGRRHDSYMLNDSDMMELMTRYLGSALYGDQGYPLRSWLIIPYASTSPTEAQLAFNLGLSKARIAVEWSFGWIVRYWKIFELRCNMKVRRNETSKYFRCMLPTLAIYLADLTSQGATDEVELSSDDGVDVFENGSDMSSWDGSDDASSESSDGDFATGYWSASDDDGDYNGSSGDNSDDNND